MKESSLSWPNEITTEGQKMNLEGNVLKKKKSHHEMIYNMGFFMYTITDAEILEPLKISQKTTKNLKN